MDVREKVIVVTGGGNGIGRALCRAFARAGARSVVVADLDAPAAAAVAQEIGGHAATVDVRDENAVRGLADATIARDGQIDLFCSNAGIETGGTENAPDEDWERIWQVNVLAHVYAARAVLPGMLARGQGYLVNTASAAGLLTQITSAPYTTTKFAAVGFAEWLAINYGDRGIKVSCLCPLGVNTNMIHAVDDPMAVFLRNGALEPETVAECVLTAVAEERFLILPHAEVAEYFQRKATDHERWLKGMKRLAAGLYGRG